MSLSTIAAADLPPLAYLYAADHDPALTEPENFRPITNEASWVKPTGGLWTAPVTRCAPGGLVLSSLWSEWCVAEMDWDAADARFLSIRPRPNARVLLVDGMDDLRRLVAEYPNTVGGAPSLDRIDRRYPDWVAVAAEWDAVYLTDAGQWATRLPPYDDPNLYGWDCPSVLWLQPAYSVAVGALVGGAK
jgi:hypothetical protein